MEFSEQEEMIKKFNYPKTTMYHTNILMFNLYLQKKDKVSCNDTENDHD